MSDQYIVSARKYRPQTFDTVVGQEHITTTLKNAIRHQHLAHAYLFCGPRGVGKTTCARILARTINCESPTPDMEACGQCTTCQSFKGNTSFNVFELDAASNNSVDDIRNLIDQVRFAPQQGKYKIYIIDEVHMLSAAAFNAFLKTLEEPPPYAIFILATTEKHKILPTILSRCQIFDFKRITTDDIVSHLHGIATKESVVAQEAALHVIAQKSEGCMRDALSMLDRIVSFTNGMLTYAGTMEHLNLLDADFYFKLTDHMLSQDISGTLLLLDQTLERGFEGDVILEGLAEHMRNLLLCKDQRMAKLLDVPNDHKPVYYEKANQAPPAFILSALNVVNDSALSYKNANNKRLHVEMCLIKLCYVLQATEIKKNSDGVDGVPVAPPAPVMPQAPVTPPPAYQPAPPPVTKVQEPEIRRQSVTNSGGMPMQAQSAAPSMVAPSGGQGVNGQHSQIQEQPSASELVNAIGKTSINEQNVINSAPNLQPQPVPAAPVPQPVTNPQPAAASYTPPPVPKTATTGNNPARRISKGLMDLDNLDHSSGPQVEKKELTQELGEEIFRLFTQKLKDANRSMYHAQFSSMKVEVVGADEVRVIAPTNFSEEYAKDQRNVLIDFYRAETGNPVVRVVTEVREDQSMVAIEQKIVLSKPEIMEAMIAKNPDLGRLRDAMGLQIEY
ncbi:DNA polymerase III subunit gamma/tau [Polluticoccus soli]|uniref:DNA polymerase III subunit gamma/tau n=1 Tax=Polluticoccus soli TaxID=3034150 RepID=UPI0023E2C96F|nr:DNA polymerase III subunit gamma/tau [Flavipsychrobacter sp. JY13-12]